MDRFASGSLKWTSAPGSFASEISRSSSKSSRLSLGNTPGACWRGRDPGGIAATYLASGHVRFYWNKRTPAAVKKGAEYFQQAVEKDPSYAAAYVGLADSAVVAGWWGFITPDQGCGRAKAAARKALEIDETAEAHASLGFVILHYDFDYLSAEKELQRAIVLNPRYATAHQWYGHYLSYFGRFDEAVVETAQALKLDPISLILHASH